MKTILMFVNGALLFALLLSFSSCADDFGDIDFLGGWGGVGYYDVGDITFDPPFANFGIDSVVQETDTTFTIWAHITCDSTLTVNNRTLYYTDLEAEKTTFETILSRPDTIDFKSLPDSVYNYGSSRYEKYYLYTVPVTLPDTSTTYKICINTEFTGREPGFDYQCVVIE
jgi:hypothetical protein